MIENIQRRTAKWTIDLMSQTLSYEDILTESDLITLQKGLPYRSVVFCAPTTIGLVFFILFFIPNCFPISFILLIYYESSFSFHAR